MTTSDWKKAFTQLDAKPTIKNKYIKHNKPLDRTHGKIKSRCQRCGNFRGMIGKYRLGLCRHCFRETAVELGFKKFR